MAGLQGRVNTTAQKPQPFESVAQDVAKILYPMLVESLYPRTFTGTIGLSIHFQDGAVCHIKQLDNDQTVPGSRPMATKEGAKDWDLDHVLQSAIRDLRVKLDTITPGYFGVVTLTMEIEAGICTLISWGRERVHRKVGR